ncbi:S8 family serine peptidase [Deinococcus planocerae]|uniref:S8 family serine peptidase n=1 Tax=Deinococcus planocerae TaxID=1737569 RepID=UPI001CA4DE4A|nr:S8 family serine peptidase [Deinococcus planocerae]
MSTNEGERMEMPTGKMTGGDMPGGQGAAMPTGAMTSAPPEGEPDGQDPPLLEEMPRGEMNAAGRDRPATPGEPEELERVLVEMVVPQTLQGVGAAQLVSGFALPGFQVDTDFPPIPSTPPAADAARLAAAGEQTVIVRGHVQRGRRAELERQPGVVMVFTDGPIAPFSGLLVDLAPQGLVQPLAGTAPCPIGTCDCAPGTAKGTMADVARYLGVDQLWAKGVRGEGIVIGIVDGGITALGRPTRPGETARIGRVIGGFPADWGTTAAAWGDHGNMTSTDALGMAPQAQIYDIRISDSNAISAALAGFQWAIERHRADGTPQILSNSWGIFQETWDRVYARDPNHPFTRKVVEALDEGILVLFAAGNCGGTCPDGRCGPDTGPGRSIWGANGHPRVMTVGAVNRDEQFVGYSSQGPAALDPGKPDFCSVTHFRGYFASDSGTSAATPIAAGVVALLKQAQPALTQEEVKRALRDTAKDIGAPGFDQHSGAGIIRAKAAYDAVVRPQVWSGWEDLGGIITAGPAVASWAPNRLDCFVKGSDNHMHHKWWDGTRWRGWEDLGGVIDDNPAAVSWGPNRIDCFARGMDNHLWHKWWS